MATITLTLSAPIAAYGTTPRLQHRLTDDRPGRNTVIGLLRCALGLHRDEPSPDLDLLDIQVESASHANRFRDFHTIRGAVTYEGKPGRNAITTRHYLAESYTTVVIEGPEDVVGIVEASLREPYWQLYLGRRCCVPDRPVLTHDRLEVAETQ